MTITAEQYRQWHRNTMHAPVEGYPWISYANSGMSYGMSEDRRRFALIDGIDWAGFSPHVKVLAESDDLEAIRDAFWAEQRNRRASWRI